MEHRAGENNIWQFENCRHAQQYVKLCRINFGAMCTLCLVFSFSELDRVPDVFFVSCIDIIFFCHMLPCVCKCVFPMINWVSSFWLTQQWLRTSTSEINQLFILSYVKQHERWHSAHHQDWIAHNCEAYKNKSRCRAIARQLSPTQKPDNKHIIKCVVDPCRTYKKRTYKLICAGCWVQNDIYTSILLGWLELWGGRGWGLGEHWVDGFGGRWAVLQCRQSICESKHGFIIKNCLGSLLSRSWGRGFWLGFLAGLARDALHSRSLKLNAWNIFFTF